VAEQVAIADTGSRLEWGGGGGSAREVGNLQGNADLRGYARGRGFFCVFAISFRPGIRALTAVLLGNQFRTRLPGHALSDARIPMALARAGVFALCSRPGVPFKRVRRGAGFIAPCSDPSSRTGI